MLGYQAIEHVCDEFRDKKKNNFKNHGPKYM